jgi:NADPH-dependent curcumin reductase CurA
MKGNHMLPKTYRKVVTVKKTRSFREAVQIVETPLEMPAPGQILVRNMFAGVNASDVNIASGVYDVGPVPFDMGVESTGEVVAVGDGVDNFKVGDYAMMLSVGGGYREYVLADAAGAIPIPMATAEITALMVGALTAAVALYEAGGMTSGETVLITAAAGGVGAFAVQFAKHEGNHVIGTCSTPEKAATLKALGCDRVVNYRTENLGEVLKAEYPDGVNLVLENVGGALFDAAVDNMAVLGRMVINGFISEYLSGPIKVTQPRIYQQLLWQSRLIRGFILHHFGDTIPKHLGNILTLYGEGKLVSKVDPTEFKGVQGVVDAVEHMYTGKNNGKIIVSF